MRKLASFFPGLVLIAFFQSAIASIAMDGAPVAVELGSAADQVRTGGSGRYLIFHVENSDKLTIVDVVAGKALKPIPAPGDFQFAADRDKLLLVLNNQHVLQRWDLATQTREKSVLLDSDQAIHVAAMGSSGNGPLALWSTGKVQFWDIATLKPIVVRGEVINQEGGVQLWPSADGLSFCAYGWTTGPFNVMRLSNLTATSADCAIVSTPDGHGYNMAWAMPTADGEYLTRYNSGVYSHDMAVLEPGPLKGAVILPTEDPRFLLALRGSDGKECQASIVAAVDRRILYTVQHLEPVMGGQISTTQGRLKSEARVRYLPKEKLLITIPDSDDQVVIHPFDLEESLKSTGADYLFVISKPATRINATEKFSYPIETLSNSTTLKFKLETGPSGMSLSPKGLLEWMPAPEQAGKKVDVIVSISTASGDEIMHAFQIAVGKETRVVAASDPAPTNSAKTLAKLTGTWRATPELDDARLITILKSQGITGAQMAGSIADAHKAMAGYEISYSFDADGSASATSGTPSDFHTLKGTWSADQETDTGVRIQLRVIGHQPEDLHILFEGPDHFTMKTPGHGDSPIKVPVIFIRVPTKQTSGNDG